MAENSKIEWTHHTFNPWRGCTKVSDGCRNCYAETMSRRNPATLGIWGDNGTRVLGAENYWKQPLRWNTHRAQCGICGYWNHPTWKICQKKNCTGTENDFVFVKRPRVFCASLADVFEDRPELNTPRARLFDLMRQTPNLDWLLLTKRPENIIHLIYQLPLDFWPQETRDMAINWLYGNPPKNVWIGTSVENQEMADRRIPELLKVPAKVRFLSCEPLLGDIKWLCAPNERPQPRGIGTDYEWHPKGCIDTAIDWVIVGGESGPDARPMHPDWARSIRDYCKAANVPIFIKQMGSEYARNHHFSDSKGGNLLEWAAEFRFREFPNAKTA